MSSIPVTLTFRRDLDNGDTLTLEPASITLEEVNDEVEWRCCGMPEGGGFSLRFDPLYGPFMAFRSDESTRLIGYGNVGSVGGSSRDYPYEAFVCWGDSEITVQGVVVNHCQVFSRFVQRFPNGCSDPSPGPPCPPGH